MTSMLRWIKKTSKKELDREGDKKTLQVKGRTPRMYETQNFFFYLKKKLESRCSRWIWLGLRNLPKILQLLSGSAKIQSLTSRSRLLTTILQGQDTKLLLKWVKGVIQKILKILWWQGCAWFLKLYFFFIFYSGRYIFSLYFIMENTFISLIINKEELIERWTRRMGTTPAWYS